MAAPFYGRLTANQLWRESVREMARHFPPSGAALRLLDVGCGPANSALELLSLRPDLHIIGLDRSLGMLRQARHKLRSVNAEQIQILLGDVCHLPLPDSSMDAVTAHSVYYLLADQSAFLAEALRVLRPGGRLILFDPAAAPYAFKVIRRAVTRLVNRSGKTAITPETMARTLENAGFARVLGERAVNGNGILSRGEKPYAAPSPIQRTAESVALDDREGDLSLIDPTQGIASVRGRHLFLLVQQTPNKPVWALKPGELITWGAATVRDGETPVALAFTSLPKAVAFMQPAVVAGVLIGINKVAKFDKATATHWDFPILVNPSLDALRDSSYYALPGPLIGIDPQTAITGEE